MPTSAQGKSCQSVRQSIVFGSSSKKCFLQNSLSHHSKPRFHFSASYVLQGEYPKVMHSDTLLTRGVNSAQIIYPEDQARMHSIGIIPSIQPTHATSDMSYAELRLGSKRIATEAYRMRSLLDLQPVLGSDFPVEPPNPLQGIYAAVTRKSPHTGKGAEGSMDGWCPEETMTLREALVGFTEGPAHGAFLDGKAGVIQPGAMADWVVLDEPLDSIDIEDLRHLKVKETWVGGRRVYLRE